MTCSRCHTERTQPPRPALLQVLPCASPTHPPQQDQSRAHRHGADYRAGGAGRGTGEGGVTVNKKQVIGLHKKHPQWTAPQIAEKLRCHPGYVRATAQRNGIKLVPGSGGASPEVVARIRQERLLGRAAMAAGLTVKKIEQLAAKPRPRSGGRREHNDSVLSCTAAGRNEH